MLIDLGDEVIFQVRIGKETYDLKEPNESQIMALSSDDDDNDDEAFAKLKGFMVELGMPADVVSSLGVFRLKKFITALTGELSTKK